MIRLSIVSYLNTAPFLYGIKHSGFLKPGEYELSLDIPSECARKLQAGEADAGIVPVAALPSLNRYELIGETCIGAVDKIDSVLLVSEVPVNAIREILLDFHSRTSVNLCRILASEYWKIDPLWTEAAPGYLESVKGDRAAVVIGDRALDRGQDFPFRYDLAEAWNRFTGLPFVFACWVAAKPLPEAFRSRLEAALQWGVDHRARAVQEVMTRYPTHIDVENYLTERVSYTLDASKKQAMETFLALLGKLSLSDSVFLGVEK